MMSRKIEALKSLLNIDKNSVRYPVETYIRVLEEINALTYNYDEWLGDNAVDRQLEKVADADYNLACALITLTLREDYWCNGAFEERYKAGEIEPIIFRMISELEKEENTTKWSDPISIDELYKTRCEGVTKQSGVYRVVWSGPWNAQFNEYSSNAEATLYDVNRLHDKYTSCLDRKVLYIGKANGRRGLYQRLKQYVLYGYNESRIHNGGRAIWQLNEASALMIEYACVDDPEGVEKALLSKYKEQNKGVLPLANWRL